MRLVDLELGAGGPMLCVEPGFVGSLNSGGVVSCDGGPLFCGGSQSSQRRIRRWVLQRNAIGRGTRDSAWTVWAWTPSCGSPDWTIVGVGSVQMEHVY